VIPCTHQHQQVHERNSMLICSNKTAEPKPQQNMPMAAETHPPKSNNAAISNQISNTYHSPDTSNAFKKKRTKLKYERKLRGYIRQGEGESARHGAFRQEEERSSRLRRGWFDHPRPAVGVAPATPWPKMVWSDPILGKPPPIFF
jgi:hypothetical protein